MRFPPGQLAPGLALDADGGLMLHLQHDDPGLDRAANWLPTPKGTILLLWALLRAAGRYSDRTLGLAPLASNQVMIDSVPRERGA